MMYHLSGKRLKRYLGHVLCLAANPYVIPTDTDAPARFEYTWT